MKKLFLTTVLALILLLFAWAGYLHYFKTAYIPYSNTGECRALEGSTDEVITAFYESRGYPNGNPVCKIVSRGKFEKANYSFGRCAHKDVVFFEYLAFSRKEACSAFLELSSLRQREIAWSMASAPNNSFKADKQPLRGRLRP
jgi:hypothetical protein